MLEVRGLSAWWGAAQALFDVSLTVRPGELVVLRGLNGAGKSTLLQAIIGIGARTAGEVCYQNVSIGDWSPSRRVLLGLGYVAEDRRLFGALSVRANLQVAARGDAVARAAGQARVLALFPALGTMLDRPAATLSGGEQQMLALGRTLTTQPKLLLLDEPCEGIAPVLVAAMRDALLQLKADGMPMLVAEQNRILADRADRVIALTSGRIDPASP